VTSRRSAVALASIIWIALAAPVFAGDAVAIGYNANGIWTAVTYFRSATPRGGKDYKTEEQAREFAMRDIRRRSQYPPTTVRVFSASEKTGYVAVARGQNKTGTDVHGVGRGKSQGEADRKALELLSAAGAGAEEKIVYRYFSYGSPSSPRRVFDRTRP
jgi:hypothetical protein